MLTTVVYNLTFPCVPTQAMQTVVLPSVWRPLTALKLTWHSYALAAAKHQPVFHGMSFCSSHCCHYNSQCNTYVPKMLWKWI